MVLTSPPFRPHYVFSISGLVDVSIGARVTEVVLSPKVVPVAP